jgi:glucosamine--fructose-6-phosphate aminotransferase (isomerizing)
VEAADKGPFPHFMLKEIHEQPVVLRQLASKLVRCPGSDKLPNSVPEFNAEHVPVPDSLLRRIQRIVIVAQGTAYHAGMIGRNMIERCARVPVQVEFGADFRYRDPVLDPNVLVLAISQSGETADTLGAVQLAKDAGCPTLGIINAVGSSIARLCEHVIHMHVGPEIGVASTKAFTGQIAALYVFAIRMGLAREALAPADARRRVRDLMQVPVRVEEILTQADEIQRLSEKYMYAQNALYLGRGTGFPHAEGYDAAEMKHGPIALIDQRMPSVFLALKGSRYEKIISNLREVKSRGGRIIAIASHDDGEIQQWADDIIRVHDDRGIMNSIVCAVPLQLIAYYVAVARGNDPDKPRNLAKSVTVE